MLETGGFALTLMPLLLEDIMARSNWLGRGAPTCVPMRKGIRLQSDLKMIRALKGLFAAQTACGISAASGPELASAAGSTVRILSH